VKANPSPLVLEALARWGGGADCASRSEVHAALAAGIPIERLSYCSPAPELRLAVWLLRRGATVIADSAEALDELRQVLDGGDTELPGRLFVRVNPGGLPGYRHASDIQRYTAHGGDTSQFGIPSEEVPGLLERYPLMVSGLHMHVGTMMDNAATFAAGLDLLHALVDLLLADTVHPVTTVNLGGGLGIPFFPQQSFPTVHSLVRELAPHLRSELDYEVEPGNSLVGDSFALLTRVAATKTARGRRWAIVDVGTDQLVKHTVARWEHQIVGPDHRPMPQEGPDAVAGPLCFAGDVLLQATELGALAKGDPLLVRHAGAYCGAIASHFNGRRAPACAVLENDGTVRLAHSEEDPFFEPMLQTYRPSGFDCAPNRGEAITPERQKALHSEYMHELANQDGYEMSAVRKVCERSYHFVVEPRAAVGFVALPLALRIVGDASILAVGHELGWETKEAPVWATRLTLTAGANLPVGEALPCRVVVSGLGPGGRPGVAACGHVHFELGENGEFRGTAKVSVPES
jgi:diaminopimelate decarboxylase